jgi:hypothetical protein
MYEYTPDALVQIDEKLGSRTVEAYHSVVYKYPWLRSVSIELDDSKINAFHKKSRGLDSSYISFNPSDESYINRLQDGRAVDRFYWAKGLIQSTGTRLRVPELVTISFLHELGHADNFHDWIIESGEDTQLAYTRSNAERHAQLDTLPLGQACSRAVAAWENNTDSYRDTMEAQGHDEVSFRAALRDNLKAYARLPSEAIPDQFARDALEQIYCMQMAA